MKRDRIDTLQDMYNYLRGMGAIHTQKDLASVLNSSAPNISRAFKGDDKYLTLSLLRRINQAFGNPFRDEWIVSGEEPMLSNEESKAPYNQLDMKPNYEPDTKTSMYLKLLSQYDEEISKLKRECALLKSELEELKSKGTTD